MAYNFPYQTQEHSLNFGDVTVKIDCITNFDDLLNALIEKGEEHEDYKDERLPYWADLWHSAIAMAQYLVAEQLISPQMSVTEIGCGLGLPSIVAAKLGAIVRPTDYLQETLDFLEQNWKKNSEQVFQGALLDWRKPDPSFQAELVLASDVAYEKRFFDELPHALSVLSKKGGRIIITEPNRAIAKPFIKQLKEMADYKLKQSSIKINWNDSDVIVNVLDIEVG